MVLINYIQSDVVIYSSKLITGEVVIRDEEDRVLVHRSFRNESLVTLPAAGWKSKWIRVTVTTGGETLEKSFQINTDF